MVSELGNISHKKDNFLAHILLPGKPVPARLMQGKNGKLYNARKAHSDTCKWKIKVQYRGKVYIGPVEIDYYFGFPIPKSWSKEKRDLAKLGGMAHAVKPDYDNLKKLVNDCIEKIIILDDSQICSGTWKKEYTNKPRTEIFIYYGVR